MCHSASESADILMHSTAAKTVNHFLFAIRQDQNSLESRYYFI